MNAQITGHLQEALDELEHADEKMGPSEDLDRLQASALLHRAMIYTQAAMQRLGTEPRGGAVPLGTQRTD